MFSLRGVFLRFCRPALRGAHFAKLAGSCKATLGGTTLSIRVECFGRGFPFNDFCLLIFFPQVRLHTNFFFHMERMKMTPLIIKLIKYERMLTKVKLI